MFQNDTIGNSQFSVVLILVSEMVSEMLGASIIKNFEHPQSWITSEGESSLEMDDGSKHSK